MERFSICAEYRPAGCSHTVRDRPTISRAISDKGALEEAKAKADALYPGRADHVVVRVLGSERQRVVGEIERPIPAKKSQVKNLTGDLAIRE